MSYYEIDDSGPCISDTENEMFNLWTNTGLPLLTMISSHMKHNRMCTEEFKVAMSPLCDTIIESSDKFKYYVTEIKQSIKKYLNGDEYSGWESIISILVYRLDFMYINDIVRYTTAFSELIRNKDSIIKVLNTPLVNPYTRRRTLFDLQDQYLIDLCNMLDITSVNADPNCSPYIWALNIIKNQSDPHCKEKIIEYHKSSDYILYGAIEHMELMMDKDSDEFAFESVIWDTEIPPKLLYKRKSFKYYGKFILDLFSLYEAEELVKEVQMKYDKLCVFMRDTRDNCNSHED
jgi:hypothetical protein